MTIYCDTQGLDEYCATDKQREILATIRECNTVELAAEKLGVSERNAYAILRRIRVRAAKSGWAPGQDMTKPVPDGFSVSGVSTLYDKDGKITAQWVKTKQEAEKEQLLVQEARQAIVESLPREKPVKCLTKHCSENLLNCYILTDYHLGMKSWHEETGEDWDVRIAEDLLVNWFNAAIRLAPNSGTAVLCQLGDFLHFDGLAALTPEHKNLLDADTRFQKVVRVAIRLLRRIIRALLKKHDRVHLIMAEGNHDPASSIWLREMFAAWYDDEPRITVDQNADPYYCYEFGKTSLFFHHGHKRKPSTVDDVFVSRFREVFGRTEFSYGHMGHMHHEKGLETNLMIVEQHRTLAAPSTYDRRGGWDSGRSAEVITYHKDFGFVGRISITPDMVSQ